jgi:hypothetical protein
VATLAQVRDGVATTLQAAISGLSVYSRVEGVANLPAVVVLVADGIDYLVVMNRATMTWQLDLHVLTSASMNSLGQLDLDELIDIAGARSIAQALYGSDLGIAETQAHIESMSGYGGSIEAAGVDHIGATLRLVVHTKGA